MHTSLQFSDRSPPGGHDASSSGSGSGQYYRGSRGFGYRKRGYSYRGRGGSYQRTNGAWYGRTTVKEEPLEDALAQSLLARIEPSSDSLLNRLSPGKERLSASGSGWPSAFDDGTSGDADGGYSRGESGLGTGNSDSVASSRNHSPQPPSMHDELAEQLIASALAQGKQLVEQHSQNERGSKSPASEAAVDDLLVADDGEDILFSSGVPENSSKVTTHPNVDSSSSRSTSVDRASVVEQAKKLFIPVIIQNARLRNPETDSEELEKKVVALVTDEQCLAFVKFAQDARKQAKGKQEGGERQGSAALESVGMLLGGRRSVPSEKSGSRAEGSEARRGGSVGTVSGEQAFADSGAKRQREPTNGGESSARPTKVLRRTTTDGSAISAVPEFPLNIARAASTGHAQTSSSLSSSSRVPKDPPTAPKAMRGISQSESSIGLSSLALPAKPYWLERTGNHAANIPNPPAGSQSSQVKLAYGAPPSVTESKNLLKPPPMARAPSASSDMDIDDDSTPSSPGKAPIIPEGSTQALSSSLHLPTPLPIPANSEPTPPAKAQMDAAQHPLESRTPHSGNVPTLTAAAKPPPSSASLDGSVGDNTSQARANEPSTTAVTASRVRQDTPSHAHLANAPVTLRTANSADAQPAPEAGRAPNDDASPPGQEAGNGNSLTSVPVVHVTAKEGEAAVPMDVDLDNRAGSAGETATSGVAEDSIQGSNEPQDSATNLPSSQGTPSTLAIPKAQPEDGDQIDVDAEAVGDVTSQMASQAAAVPSATGAPSSQQNTTATAVGNSSISPTDVPIPGDIVSSSTTLKTASPSPALASADESANAIQPVAPLSPPSLSSPYLYFAELGKPSPQVSTLTFDVASESAAAASRWNQRREKFDPSTSHVVFHLLCLHAADAEKAAAANPTATPEEFAAAMWGVRTRWPRRGQLLLEINSETDSRGSWIPKQLGPEDGPIDLTPHIVPGINTVRVIQLAPQTDRIFIVYAGPPPEDEVKQFTDTAKWERFALKI